MNSFYHKEDLKKYMAQQIICNNDIINAIEIACKTIKNFDGKVFNIKLKKAIETAFEMENLKCTSIHFDKYNSTIYCRDNDHYKIKDYHGAGYVDYTFYLMTIKTSENNRITADINIENWQQGKQNLIEKTKKISLELSKIDEIENEFLQLKQQIKSFNDSYSNLIKSLFNTEKVY